MAVALTILVLIALGLAATRYGVLLPQARLMIEARTDGLKIGRFGKLKIDGPGRRHLARPRPSASSPCATRRASGWRRITSI